MPATPEISVIVSSYQRPGHLRRCLASLDVQREVTGQFEVIVVDDGSRDETPDVVARTAREVGYRLTYITHPHEGYQLSRCRNSGIRAAQAPYLLFTDGDCLFPPDHLGGHLNARKVGVVRAGDCLRFDQATSEQIDEAKVRSGKYLEGVADASAKFRRRAVAKARFHQIFRRRDRPKLTGWNIAAWRDQLVRVNGFDERYRSWGCEDDDLAARLRVSGARIQTAVGHTHAYHLWHPIDPTAPKTWRDGANVGYHRRQLRLTRCLMGLAPRTLDQAAVRITASDEHAAVARQMFPSARTQSAAPDLEILFWPCGKGFSRDADCRVLVHRAGDQIPRSISRRAHATISIPHWNDAAAARRQLEALLGLSETPMAAAATLRDAA